MDPGGGRSMAHTLACPPVAVFDREGYDAGFFSRLVSDGRPFVSWEKNVDKRIGRLRKELDKLC